MLSTTSVKAISALALAASAVLAGAATAAPAFATPPTATYGVWGEPIQISTDHTHHTGTISFGASGISNATYDTTFGADDQYNEVTVHDNSTEWMSEQTPFGAVFGRSDSSTDNNFLRVDVAATETTVITFDTPVPANSLGLAIGDLDVDSAVVTATDGSNTALTDSQLTGSATPNAFNLCAVDANPYVCNTTVFLDAPLVSSVANSVTFDPNAGDDIGVTGWIYPSTAIKTLTIFHTSHNGGSSLRYWLAAINQTSTPAPTAAVDVPTLSHTAAPDAGLTLWIALALGLVGTGGLVAAQRRKVNA